MGMVRYTIEHGYYRDERDFGWSRRVGPGAATWKQFLRRTGWRGEPHLFGP